MKPGRVRGWVRTHDLTNVELKRVWKKHLTTDLYVSPLWLPSSFQVFLASWNMVNGLMLNDVMYRPLSLAPRINLSLHVSSYRRSWIFHAFLLAIKTMSYLTPRWRNLFTKYVKNRTYWKGCWTANDTTTRCHEKSSTRALPSLPWRSILLTWPLAGGLRTVATDKTNTSSLKSLSEVFSLLSVVKDKTKRLRKMNPSSLFQPLYKVRPLSHCLHLSWS